MVEKTSQASRKVEPQPPPQGAQEKKNRALVRGQEREQALEDTGAAEPEDYQQAGRDYVEGGSPEDAERVLS